MSKTERKYDYLIVGAGFTGCFLAYHLARAGYSVHVVDKEPNIGGACYSENINGIEVHKFGPHIYRTDSKENWCFLNKFSKFNNFINEPIANYNGELYNMPFNMNTFNKIWPDVITPEQAKAKIQEEINRESFNITNPQNLEEKAISLIGRTLYEKLIKEYTEKQWGAECKDLPAYIISVLPVRFTFNNNYFNKKYQGIPVNGYTDLLGSMLINNNIDLTLNHKITSIKDDLFNKADRVIYTGRLDSLFGNILGRLPYRGAEFIEREYPCNNYQGVAVMNYTSKEVPYIRTSEYKHFTFGDDQAKTIVAEEYSVDATNSDDTCYYPIVNEETTELQNKYYSLLPANFYTCGVCGDYQNYTMDDCIEAGKKLLDSLNVNYYM